MKRIVCEMCGSSDIVKQDGLYVCQSCGTKYSVEEAKKMMVEGVVEVTGTVKIDNSAAISNYLDIARNALKAGNEKEAEDYCNRILETDVTNWEAWYIKGCAVGWQSTNIHSRISETIACYTNALQNCPEDTIERLKEDCKNTLDRINKAILSIRMDNINTYPNEDKIGKLSHDITHIFNSSGFMEKFDIKRENNEFVKFARQINVGLCSAWKVSLTEYEGTNGGHPYKFTWETFVKKGDALLSGFQQALTLIGTRYDDEDGNALIIQIYENMITLQSVLIDSCSYKCVFINGSEQYVKDWSFIDTAKQFRRNQIQGWRSKISEVKTTGAKKVIEMANKRREAYWAEHAEERTRLETRLKELNEQIDRLNASLNVSLAIHNKELAEIPGTAEINRINEKIQKLSADKEALGIFKVKEKKALQEQIDQAEAEKTAVKDRLDAAKKALEARFVSEKNEIQRKINALQDGIIAINTELTKAR